MMMGYWLLNLKKIIIQKLETYYVNEFLDVIYKLS